MNQRRAFVFDFFFMSCLMCFFILFSTLQAGEVKPQKASMGKSFFVAVHNDYPPFSFLDEDDIADGFSIELLKYVLKPLGTSIGFKSGSPFEIKEMFKNGELDIFSFVCNAERDEALFDFSIHYLTLPLSIVIREDEKTISDFFDLKGKTVSVFKCDFMERFFREKGEGINLKLFPSHSDCFMELSKGQCEAVITHKITAFAVIEKLKLSNLKVLDQTIENSEQKFCFAVRKGDHETLSLINEGLLNIFADGTYARLSSHWLEKYRFPISKKIIVGGDWNYPPFEFIDDNGNPSGFSVDVLKAVAKEKKIEIEIKLGEWSTIKEKLKNGEIDLIEGMFYSPARGKIYDFSRPYIAFNYVSVVRNDGRIPPPSSIRELKGIEILLQKGDIMHEILVAEGIGKIRTVSDMKGALVELSKGNYDCAIVPSLTAHHIIKSEKLRNLKISSQSVYTGDFCFAVKKGNKALLIELNDGLKIIEESGELQALQKKYFGIFNGHNYVRVILLSIGVLLFCLLVSFLWIYSLRKSIAAKIAKLNEYEHRYVEVFHANRDGFVIVDMKGKILDANKSYCDMLGYSLSELKKLPNFYSITPEKWHKWEREEIWEKRLLSCGYTELYEKEYIKKNGEVFPIEIQAGTIKDIGGERLCFWEVVRNISDRKRAESEIKNKLICESIITSISTLSINATNTFEFFEGTVREIGKNLKVGRTYIFETQDAGLSFKNTHEWTAEMVPSVKDSMQGVKNSDFKWFDSQIKSGLIKIDDICQIPEENERKYLEKQNIKSLMISPFFLFDKIVGFIGVDECCEIRKWTKSEEELLSSISKIISNTVSKLRAMEEERLLSVAIEECSEVVVITDRNGLMKYVNRAFERVTGYSKSEVIGKKNNILKSGKQDLAFYTNLWKTILSGETWRGRFTNKKKDGSLYIEDAVISPVILKDGQINNFVAIKKDVTEQIKLENQFYAAQKMESIGRLAGGVAHDFNNMLSVILGFAEIAMSKIDEKSTIKKDIEQIIKAGKRSADLTRQLLVFARKDVSNPKVIEVNSMLEDSIKMLKRLIREEISVKFNPSRNDIKINIDPIQLEQVLMNLCINSRDAISGKGLIEISTNVCSYDKYFCQHNLEYLPGDFAVISVRDTGCGMDEVIINNIFEPFFTTKAPGKGTGLGLSTVYGIVKQNKGFIIVSSAPGKGSVFHVHIPVFDRKPLMEKSAIKMTELISKSPKNTIMIVEDEPSLLSAYTGMLEDAGYHVINSGNPVMAIEKAKNYKDEISLLITDVIMPDMNGIELAAEISKIHPECKILYMSGYAVDAIKGGIASNVNILHKPFTKVEFIDTLKNIFRN